MKKLIALLVTVAMLSFAGSAMAALTVSADSTTVTVEEDATATLSFTVSGGATTESDDIDEYAAVFSTSYPWASISAVTSSSVYVTLSPRSGDAGNNLPLALTVTHTYGIESGDDTVGHTIVETTESATSNTVAVTITKKVTPAPTPTPPTPTTTGEVQIIIRGKETGSTTRQVSVTIIGAAAQGSASVQTFAQAMMTAAAKFTQAFFGNIPGYNNNPVLTSRWSGRGAEIDNSTNAAINSAEKRAVIFGNIAGDTTPRDNSDFKEMTGSVSDSASTRDKLAAATSRVGGNNRALSALGKGRAEKDGSFGFSNNFGEDLYNVPISGDRGAQGALDNTSNGFYASAVDNTGVAFLNSKGEKITSIPGLENSADVMPGYVKMLVVMKQGEIYEPIIYTTSTALAAAGVSEDAGVAVTVTDVTYGTETVVIDADGNETVVNTAALSADALAKVQAAFGTTKTFSNAAPYIGAVSASTISTNKTLASNDNLFIAATLPSFNGLADGGWFYGPFGTFADPSTSTKLVSTDAVFDFYPNGIAAGSAVAKIFDSAFNDITDKAKTSLNKTGTYIAFIVSGSSLVASEEEVDAAEYTLSAPFVTTDLTSTTPTPTPTTRGVYGASGGCSAGSAVLALAVLGSFILTRKK